MIWPEKFAPGMAKQLQRFHNSLTDGMPRCGWKLGINVPEVRQKLAIPHPAVGWLDGRRLFFTGSEIPFQPESKVYAEPEVAIRIAAPVPAGSSPQDARDLIDAVHPALELVDYSKPGATFDEVLEFCMFHDATVLGPPSSLKTASELGRDWPILRVAGGTDHSPRGDLVPEDFGELIAFVASYLGAFGQSLLSGEIVLSGSYIPRAAAISPGEEVIGEFGPVGRVSVKLLPRE